MTRTADTIVQPFVISKSIKKQSHKKSGVRKLVTAHAIDAVRMNQESKNKEKCQPQSEPQPFLDLMIIFMFALL